MSKELVTTKEYLEQLSAEMVKEILRIVDQQDVELGMGYGDQLVLTFIAGLVGNVVYNVLTSRPDHKVGKEEVNSYVQQAFSNVKSGMQNSVAAGFQAAMSTFAKQQIEYYCQILPIPQPANKLSN